MIAIRKRARRRHADGRAAAMPPPFHAADLPMPAHNEDYLRLIGEATVLRRRKAQIGVAVVLGEVDCARCAAIQRAAGLLGDYVSHARWGPFVVVAFQRCLFEQLKPMWQDLLAGAPDLRAGVAFAGEETSTHDLVLAARRALERAIRLQCDLVAFDERESRAAVAGPCDSPPASAVISAAQARSSSVS
ncbi:MAG TPA: hypothetical protein VF801_11430 [Rhodocyclaceae bacterium]